MRELQERMDSREFSEWLAFYKINSEGAEPQEKKPMPRMSWQEQKKRFDFGARMWNEIEAQAASGKAKLK